MSVANVESVVIFGCGYLGSALAADLVADGVRVGALTRNPGTAATLRERGLAEVVEARLESTDWHGAFAGAYEAVVNCVSSAGGGIAGYRSSYLEGQRSALRWATARGIRRYLFTGSTSVYPQGGGARVDETADTAGAPETGRILRAAEALLEESGPRFERYHIFRLAGIYGPGRHHLLDRLLRTEGPIPGSGAHRLNMVRLEDIVAAIRLALDPRVDAPSGIYNLVDDDPRPKAEVLAWLAERLGRPPPEFDPGAASARLELRGGRMPDRRIDNAKARALLGWRPRFPDFRAGYAELVGRAAAGGSGDPS